MKRTLLLITLFLAPASFAQPGRTSPPQGWSAGVMGLGISSPYLSGDDDLLVVPIVQYEGPRAYFRGLRFGYRLVNQQPWTVAVIAQPRLLHLDAEDFPIETSIRDRKRSIDVGFSVERPIGRVRVELTAVTDVLGRSNGQEVVGRVALPLRFGPVAVTPDASLRYWSDSMTDYYAGIEAGEVRPGGPVYDPANALVPEAGISARVPLSSSITFSGQYRYRFLPEQLTDSPLIDEDSENSIILGITYRFARR